MSSALALALVVSGPVAAGEIENPQYRGHFLRMPNTEVAFRTKLGRSGTRYSIFEAVNVPRTCDDGTTRRDSFGPGWVTYTRKRTFYEKTFYVQPPSNEYSVLEVIRGHISKSRRFARGYFKYEIKRLEDSPSQEDPDLLEPEPPPNPPSCKTDGRLRWRAVRVR